MAVEPAGVICGWRQCQHRGVTQPTQSSPDLDTFKSMPSEDYHCGLVDQMEDRRLCKAKALGSSPSESIDEIEDDVDQGGCGQLGCTEG